MPLGARSGSAREALSLEDAFERQKGRLLDFIRRRIGDVSDAEDVLQEVFLLASKSVTQPIEDLTAWLFTVARHKAIDWYRKRRPARLSRATESTPDGQEERLADPASAPDRAYWRSVFWSVLADALDELPEEQRDIFVAHELEGLSFKEIAEKIGEPMNTLLSRKHYAVLYLRERLRDVYADLERR